MSDFYKNYVSLCAERQMSPSGVAKVIGLSNAAANGWKKGKTPNDTTLEKLSNYFDVPVSALVGDQTGQEEGEKEKPTENGELSLDDIMEILRPLPRDELVDIAARVMELLKEK